VTSPHIVLRALAVVIALVVLASCTVEYQHPSDPPSTPTDTLGAEFVVQLVSVVQGRRAAYLAHLRSCLLPRWKDLRESGTVSTVSVFELIDMETTLHVTPAWCFLLVAGLAPGTSNGELFHGEDSACATDDKNSIFTVIRKQRMRCTANSCFGSPEPSYPDAPAGIDYLIEFIAVENIPASITTYHDLMRNYFGPANGILVERGLLHCFVALELTGSANHGYDEAASAWNQVHLSDQWDEGGDIDWEVIYEDLFRREFSRELDEIWSQIPPTQGFSTEYRARLVPDLCVR
jgi:hypothetical protein